MDRKKIARASSGTVISIAAELGAGRLSDIYGWRFVVAVAAVGLVPLIWGWWPEAQGLSLFRVSLHEAARKMYEAVEAQKIARSVTDTNYSSAEVPLDYFAHVLMSRNIDLFGVRDPSTKPLLLPKNLTGRFAPATSQSAFKPIYASDGPGYHSVTVRRRDYKRALRGYIAMLKRLDGKMI